VHTWAVRGNDYSISICGGSRRTRLFLVFRQLQGKPETMKAIVDKPFDGAPDGELYPRHFESGHVVEGDLARVAVQQGWASISEPQSVDKPARGAGKTKG
jgi:hypothetical protein